MQHREISATRRDLAAWLEKQPPEVREAAQCVALDLDVCATNKPQPGFILALAESVAALEHAAQRSQ